MQFDELAEPVQKEILQESQRTGISADEFAAEYTGSTTNTSNFNTLLIGGVFLAVTVLAIIIWLVVKRSTPRASDSSQSNRITSKNDVKRQQALTLLNQKILEYHNSYQRYPAEREFNDLFEAGNIPPDPRNGQPIPSRGNLTYGFYYDQYLPNQMKTDEHVYRVWCYLENGRRYIISSDNPTPTIIN